LRREGKWRTLGARAKTNNKFNPHMTLGPGTEPVKHWWEASALHHFTTPAPPVNIQQIPALWPTF